jgi:lysophospholipase L1-like esterase
MHVGLGLNLGVGLGVGNAAVDVFSPFLPAGDSTLLENVDFRNGLNSGILTGWTQRGTGHTYDTRGFHTATGGLRLESDSLSTALQSSGSIIIEVERSALVYNDASKDAADFEDLGLYNPGGGYPTPRTATSNTPFLFYSNERTGFTEERILYLNLSATATTFAWTDDRAGAVSMDRVADYVPSFLDPQYATVILTWSGTTEYLIVDGLVLSSQTTSGTSADRLKRIELCGGGDVASRWWGDYAIRRLQISTMSMAPTTSSTKVAFLGDSFVQRATDRASVSSDTVAQFDAQQSDLAINATRLARINQGWGNGNWGWWLQSFAYLRNRQRKWFTIYNAGYSGRGWRSDVGTQFGTVGQRAAVIAHNPNVLVCFGSVNDVNLADTTEDIVADITTYLTPLIAGCTNLTRVFWFHTFFTPETYRTNNTAAHYTEVNRQIAKFNTLSLTVNNASAQPVTVQFIPTWAAWAPGGTGVARYGIGSHPDNSTATKRTASVDGDVHPTSEGSARMAEIVWPYLRHLI